MIEYAPEELLPRLAEFPPATRDALSRLLHDARKGAAMLQVLNDADHLESVLAGDRPDLPGNMADVLSDEDMALFPSLTIEPDEFEAMVRFYEELHPGCDHGLGRAMKDVYDEAVEMAASRVEDEILSDREATTVVMELALPLSHQFDKDQQEVADDISASFTYSHGMTPEDYADSRGNCP